MSLLVVLGAAACGSSGSGSSGSTHSGSSGTTKSASKAPLLVGIEAPVGTATADFGSAPAGLDAAVATINSQGGVGGRPIKVDFCNTENQPNQEIACARKLISDGVVATIGQLYEFAGQSVESLFAAHHIADIEYTGPEVQGYEDANVYPLTWELGSFMPCSSKTLQKTAGGNKVAAIALDDPGAQALVGWEKSAAISQGAQFLSPLYVPATVTDYAPYVAKAVAEGANILISDVPTGGQAIVRAASSSDAPFTLCTALGLTQPGGWAGLGSANKKLYIGATFQALNVSAKLPLLKEFVKSMAAEHATGNKYAVTTPDGFEGQEMDAWLGAQAFKQVVSKMSGAITAAAVEKAFSHATLNLGGIIPNVDFAKSPMKGGPFTRVYNAQAYLWRYDPTSNTYAQQASIPNALKVTFGG